MMRLIVATTLLAIPFASGAFGLGKDGIDVCKGGNRAARHVTCVYDGDTGWEKGVKWRLLAIDAPEISDAKCPRERALSLRSRDRVIELLRDGYRIRWSGEPDRKGKRARELVSLTLQDGRDLGSVLIYEGLAQRWPNVGNIWCENP